MRNAVLRKTGIKLGEVNCVFDEAHSLPRYASNLFSDELSATSVRRALKEAENLWLEGKFKLKPEFEDVHLNIENFVVEKTGIEVGGKLHTGRSRNEQIILDLRLYLRKEINEIVKLTLNLTETFLNLAKKHLETVMPGYTHLQHAQPITFAHWLTAYTQMFLRDIERLEKTYQFINLCPIGASALAGTSWPIKRKEIAKLLGFDGFQENSLDVVTSRGEDLAEFFANLSILMVHLSRLMGDLMIWSTYEFRMVEFDDSYAMASSIMPQKKNPDIAELIRGKTSFTISQLQHTLYLMKGLPSGYFKDLQETKLAVFKLTETIKQSLKIVKGVISTLKIDRDTAWKEAREYMKAGNTEQMSLTGIESSVMTSESTLNIYPNPARELLNIASQSELDYARFYNVTGQMVMDITLNGVLSQDVNVSGLGNGLYIIQVQDVTGEMNSVKFMKQ